MSSFYYLLGKQDRKFNNKGNHSAKNNKENIKLGTFAFIMFVQ